MPVTTVVWLIGFVGQAIFFIVPTQLPFVMTDSLGAPPQMVGLAIAASTLSAAVAATCYHLISARFSYAWIFAFISGAISLSFLVLSVVSATSIVGVFVGLAIGGLGFGLLLPNMTVWLSEVTHESLRGRAIGVMMTAMFLGQFASPLLAQPLLDGFGPRGLFLAATAFVAIGVFVFAIQAAMAAPQVRR
jgi:MFS family permease